MRKVKVAHMNEMVPLIGKKVYVNDEEIGLFLTDNSDLKAIGNKCPHQQGPLTEGTVSGNHVYCPLHDTKVSLDTGAAQEPDEHLGCVNTYEVEVEDGEIFVCVK
ncbi:nitrite reductase (NAD(P)H) small subunit [Salinicoccus roseus]|uniref:nitrite reductase (NAD(P)H) small subunit n=1 Tax=Salinicoccus roseus TaxID=45670 RepID=UPI0022FFE73A|nr:nitrite reductase (NAD(P)H) small subunit [Salinicoccus roseus]